MKMLPILLVICVILVGCERQESQDRGRPTSLRWAVAKRSDIQFAIDRWSQDRIAEATSNEKLSPEQAAQMKEYESLNDQLMRFRRPMPYTFPMRMSPVAGGPFVQSTPMPSPTEDTNREAQYEALLERVGQARAAIQPTLNRRDQEAQQIRRQYTPDKLVAEYVGDRFDVVVDSSYANSMNSPILYQKSPEVVDITDGVLKLLEEKIQAARPGTAPEPLR